MIADRGETTTSMTSISVCCGQTLQRRETRRIGSFHHLMSKLTFGLSSENELCFHWWFSITKNDKPRLHILSQVLMVMHAMSC
jgi:hypothetical protein